VTPDVYANEPADGGDDDGRPQQAVQVALDRRDNGGDSPRPAWPR
jgi:hypothetical protein